MHPGMGLRDSGRRVAIGAMLGSLWMHAHTGKPWARGGASLADEPTERSKVMSRGEIAYEAYHAALEEYRRTPHDPFTQAGRWARLSPQFQAAGEAASHAVVHAVAERPREPTA